MLTRIILKGLPSYDWKSIKSTSKIKYKGAEGTKQITYDVTSTAFHKLEEHKKITGLSKARIIQSLILNYKPLSKAKLEYQRLRDQEMKRKYARYDD